jgi:hypothetical protein
MADLNTPHVIQILRQILDNKPDRERLISDFQQNIWDDKIYSENDKIQEVLRDLAYDLDFYEPDEKLRQESPSFYGDERVETEILDAIRLIIQITESGSLSK